MKLFIDTANIDEIRAAYDLGVICGPQDVTDAAKCGAHIATVPYKVILQMIKHPLTDIGIQKFMADWNAAFKQ